MTKKKSWTDEQMLAAIANNQTIARVLIGLGLKPSGANYAMVYREVERLKANTTHWSGKGHLKGKTHSWNKQVPLNYILAQNSTYNNGNSIKRRLLKEGLLSYNCYACDLVDWRGKPISLHLEHKNGIHHDNRIENLTLLCPNCHSQTSTYTGKNKGWRKKEGATAFCPYPKTSWTPERKEKTIKKESLKALACTRCAKDVVSGNTFCSTGCYHDDRRGKPRPNQYKVSHPSKEELAELLKSSSYLALGTKFGVSDNAVKKWAIGYGIYNRKHRPKDTIDSTPKNK